MINRRKRTKQKIFLSMMSLLLLLSLVMPSLSFAQENDKQFNDYVPTLSEEDELALEIAREKNPESYAEKQKSLGKSSSGLPSLLDGLGLDDEEGSNPDEFLLNGKLEAAVMDAFESDKSVGVIIRLKDQVDFDKVYEEVSDIGTHSSRVQSVVGELQAVANATQTDLLNALATFEKDGLVENITPFWVFNGASAFVSEEALDQLVKRDDIDKITLDRELQLPEYEISEQPPRLPEWGLEKINATDVWGEYGIDGEGVVVGIMDTGVKVEHEALAHNYRGIDGNHQNSWIDLSGEGYETPNDGNGHGTHVAGTAVGGGAGEPIGVAPGAEWIAAKIFNDGGGTTTATIHEAFQWFLAPGGDATKAPHVVNNSWGSADTYNTEFYGDVEAWVAAGIFPLFSAGNEGPGSQTIGSPGSFPNSFSIGATDSNDQIASFSSRGAVYWQDDEGNTVEIIKPEVSAPGHLIYSAWPDGSYNTISGTSMASPHVAGTIALLLEANPELSIEEVADILERTARVESHMGTVPNSNYGHGIINAYQAVTETAFAGKVSGELQDASGQPLAGTIEVSSQNIKIDVEEDGKFEFSVREGSHEVTVSSFGYNDIVQTLEIVKDQVQTITWKLEESDQFTLTGTLTEAGTDKPISYAYINLLGTPVEVVRTNDQGQFSIPNLPKDEYQVLISASGYKSDTKTVLVDENKVLDFSLEALPIEASDEWSTAKNNQQRNAVSNVDIDGMSLEKNWEYKTSGSILFASPVVAEGYVVATTDRGTVVALDVSTGEEKWTITTGNGNRSTPTVVDGVVYVAGGANKQIYAIELTSGVVKWTAEVDLPATYESPVYIEGVVYVSAGWNVGSKLTALDAETGTKLWDKVVGDGAAFGAGFTGDSLLIGLYEGQALKSLSPVDGTTNWSFEPENGEGFSSQAVFVDGVVYAFSTNYDTQTGTLWAINSVTGEALWNTTGIGDTQAGSPVVYGDLIIVGSASVPVLKAFDKNTGKLVWQNDYINAMTNNGSVSGNGLLFVTDSSRSLHVLDVQTGKHLYQYSLADQSTSNVALSNGQVVVATLAGIESFESLGTLTGTITDQDGNALQGKVEVLGSDLFVQTDENGYFELGSLPGTKDVKVSSYGFIQVVEEIEFVSGITSERNYVLDAAGTGSMSGSITDERTGANIEGVTVKLMDTPLESVTSATGIFTFDSVYEGTYTLELSYGGYVKTVQEVTIEAGVALDIAVVMTPIDVAVLNDYDSEITKYLLANNIPVEERGWDVVDDLARYEILYLNGAYTSGGWQPDEAQFKALVEEAEKHDVSIVFADSWGTNYGTIEQLNEFYGDPASYEDDTSSFNIQQIRVDQEHPIVAGLPLDQLMTVDTSGDLAWFNQYSGRHLVSIGSTEDGLLGTGVAYKGVSEDSAHVLLASHGASPWTSPYNSWLQAKHTILLNTIDYLINDAQFGSLNGVAKDADGNPLEVSIEVLETGVTTTSNPETGEFNLFHDEGTFKVSFRKSGYATQELDITFANGSPVKQDVNFTVSEAGSITGQVTNKLTGQAVPYAQLNLYDSTGTLVTEEVGNINGFYEFANLAEAVYTVEVFVRGYVTDTQEVDVRTQPIEINFDVYPAPSVATIGDSSSDNLKGILMEVGIESQNYSYYRDVTKDIANYDVVFFNSASSYSNTEEEFFSFQKAADENGVSIIYGDNYYSSSGTQFASNYRGDPGVRKTVRDTTKSAGYVVTEENPIFGEAKVGEFVDILIPAASSVAYFEDYSGYPLASITHEGNETPHGIGVAYKPRTADSLEIIMGGHGIYFSHYASEYTETGKRIFIDSILWASSQQFNEIAGTVTGPDGEPIYSEIKNVATGKSIWTDPETGSFSTADIDGDYQFEVSAFGYVTKTVDVTLNNDTQPVDISLVLNEEVGSFEGMITNEETLDSIENADIQVVGFPREATSNISGFYKVSNLMPGTYDISVEADGYVTLDLEVEVLAGVSTELDVEMKPSPTVGVIVDGSSSYMTLDQYLTNRGYIVEHLFYTDIDALENIDLVYANSDYNNSLIPEKDEFIAFLDEIDRLEIPVIWPGNHGPRGSIRYLVDYIGDPAVENRGFTTSSDRTMTGTILKDHPIFNGIDSNEIQFNSNYYYGFEDYSGETLAEVSYGGENKGGLVAYKGRTINSVEVLLSTMTFGYGFTNEEDYFDENRKRIVNNAILWALDNEEAFVGELNGKLTNNLGRDVAGTVTVEETGYTFDTEQDGSFFLALDEGTYTLSVSAFGHAPQNFEATFTRGEVATQSFELTSDAAGVLKGNVTSIDTGESIEGAQVSIVGTPLTTTTDANGDYELQALVGEHEIRVTGAGYSPHTQSFTIADDEELVIDIALSISQKVALIASTIEGPELQSFLQTNGYEVDLWDRGGLEGFMDVLSEYALVIYNDRYTSEMPEAEFKAFIEAADEHEVSIIFPSQYGSNLIRDLKSSYGNPVSDTYGFVANHINYEVTEKHPIFAGFEVGDTIKLAISDGNQQYAVFEDYSGTTLANVTNDTTGYIGEGMAYEFRTANNVHLLLGSLKASSNGSPENRWTEDAKQIYINAVDWAINASLGEISGTVTDANGGPIAGATVSIVAEGLTTTTNIDGNYSLGVGLGDHEVKVQALGYVSQTQVVKVTELGEAVVQDFSLVETTRASLTGEVVHLTTKEPIEGATVKLVEVNENIESETTTDANGSYSFEEILAGEYEVTVSLVGYQSVTKEVSIAEGEHVELTFDLSDYNVAVLGDYEGEVSKFLEENGLAAESRDWNIVDDAYNYEVIVVNASKGSKEQVDALIAASNEHEVSLVFVDTWGLESGSFHLLEQSQGYPTQVAQGYDEGEVQLEVNQLFKDHEIFAGIDTSGLVTIHPEKSFYSTFKDFKGVNLGNVVVDGNAKGASIAYDFRSENHVQVLMSTFASNNTMGPSRGWTAEGQQLFFQAVKWARDAKQGVAVAPEWDKQRVVSMENELTLTGIAQYRSSVDIYVDGDLVTTVDPEADNTYSVDLTLEDGDYTVRAIATNFAGSIVNKEDLALTVFTAPTFNVTDGVDYSNEDTYTLTGNVLVDGEVSFTQNGESVGTVKSEDKKFTKVLTLEDGENLVEASVVTEFGETGSASVVLIKDTTNPDLTITNPVDGIIISSDVVDVNGVVTDDYLQSVTVNEQEVKVNEDGTFNTQLILPEGEHTITVTASDLAGNVTSVEVTITVDHTEPVLTDVQPASDMYVQAGDKVDVSFRSDVLGGDASFTVELPLGVSSKPNSIKMDEVEAGYYVGEWTVPLGITANGAVISIEMVDLAENKMTATAEGKIFIINEKIDRIFGDDRYETAVEISKNNWLSSETVILARGDDYADGLVGTSLAFMHDAPMLLSRTDRLANVTKDEIKRLGAKNVIILGGQGAISDDVEAEIKAMGVTIDRISGADRFKTAALIAARIAPQGSETAVVVDGNNFPDALSVAAHAAKEGLPVLLTRSGSLPKVTQAALTELNVQSTIVIGGDNAVSDKVFAQLPNPERIFGSSRYETNVAVNEYFAPNTNHLYVATGTNFADALTGAVVAAKNDSSIILVKNSVSDGLVDYINAHEVNQFTIFGGENVVSSTIEQRLLELLQ